MTRWLSVTMAVTLLSSLPVACGGSSESNSFKDSSSGGSGGGSGDGSSSSDGSGGSETSDSNGSSASGSNGSSASGGSSSSGSGGSDSSGSTSRGAGGSGGSDNASTGGSGGTGGGSVTNPVPSDEAVAACTEFCERKDAAECENEQTLEACLEGCNVTTRVLDCEDELLSALECIETAEASCNDAGEARFEGCDVVSLAWWACILSEAPDEDLLEPCEDRCAAVQRADCPGDDESMDNCILGCSAVGTVLPECKGDWEALLECGQGEEFVCNDDGNAEAPSDVCGVEQLSTLICLLESQLP